MKWVLSIAMAAMLLLPDSADAQRRRFRQQRPQQQPRQFWPFDREEARPEPRPNLTPDGPHLDDLIPAPQPDPESLPPAPVEEEDDWSVPEDPRELNTYIAGNLGGYARANHLRNGVNVDIYQARGKQRIAWVVADCKDWMSAIGKAFYLKATTGTNDAGVILVCAPPEPTPVDPPVDPPAPVDPPVDPPAPVDPPVDPPVPDPPVTPDVPDGPVIIPEPWPPIVPGPEPAPPIDPSVPSPEPQPTEPEVVPPPDEVPLPPPPETATVKMMKRHGGVPLCCAYPATKISGLWLVVVSKDTGEVNRVIYAPQPVR